MRSPIILLRFIAKAVLNVVAGGLPVGDFLVEVLPELGRDVYGMWADQQSEAERQSEIEALLLIPDSDAPGLAAEIVAEVATDQPKAVRQFVTVYLTMVPAAARDSLQGQGDPSGTNVPPPGVPCSANDLVRLLQTAADYVKRGNSRKARGDLVGALADYDRAVRLDPGCAHAYQNRGLAYYARRDYDSAIAAFDQAISLDPKYYNAYYNRGLARRAKGDLKGALADFFEADRLAPNKPYARRKIDAIRRHRK